MQYYVANVALLIEADSIEAANDACAEILRGQCQDFAPDSALVTWAHTRDLGQTTLDRGAYPVGASYDAPVPGQEA